MTKTDKPALSRRTAMAGAGTAGALAAAAALLPGTRPTPTEPADAKAATDPGGPGYRLTEHIRQYYAKARI